MLKVDIIAMLCRLLGGHPEIEQLLFVKGAGYEDDKDEHNEADQVRSSRIAMKSSINHPHSAN